MLPTRLNCPATCARRLPARAGSGGAPAQPGSARTRRRLKAGVVELELAQQCAVTLPWRMAVARPRRRAGPASMEVPRRQRDSARLPRAQLFAQTAACWAGREARADGRAATASRGWRSARSKVSPKITAAVEGHPHDARQRGGKAHCILARRCHRRLDVGCAGRQIRRPSLENA